jgi:hypothetical protein
MLTRGQVAKQLGVSIAAVRRFEGVQLHPEMRGGEWWFDPAEVEQFADLRRHGGGRLTTPFRDSSEVSNGLRARLNEVENKLEAQGERVGNELLRTQDAQQADETERCLTIQLLRQALQQLQVPIRERQEAPQREEQVKRELAEREHARIDPTIVDARVGVLETLTSLSSRKRVRFLRDNPEVCDLPGVKKALPFHERLLIEQAKIDDRVGRMSGKSSTAEVLVTGAVVAGVAGLAIYCHNKWVRRNKVS